MIRIAITDDHPAIAEGLKSMLEAQNGISITAVYPDGRTTLNELPGSRTDILLLDINLPDMDGLEVCRSVAVIAPGTRIIAFTSYRETSLMKSMIQGGASGYLLKNSSLEEILEAIHAVRNGAEYIQPEMKELLLRESLHRFPDRRFIPRLTRREKEILALILEEQTTQEIAGQLFVSPKTIETHRLNLLQKLGVKNTAGLVRVTLERGLLQT
jgi:DNA-binding NarL/FixJ family response regulator